MNKKNISLTPIYMTWLLLAVFYGYQYFLRITPSIMVKEVCSAFSLTAEQFAMIPASYLYAYGMLQIPMGFILDFIGIKRTMLISVLVSVLGILLFFVTENIMVAYFARFLVGLGAAGTFIAPLKLAGDHLPPGKRGMIIGLTLTFGTIGALLAGRPQSALLQYCGWREVGLWSAMGGLVILLLMIAFIPKSEVIDIQEKESEKESFSKAILSKTREVIKNKNLVIYGFLALGLYGPLTVLSDTWGVSYLATKYQLAREDAAGCISFIFIGLCFGSFVIPGYFERKKAINQGIVFGLIAMLVSYSIFLFTSSLSIFWIKAFLFIFGFVAGAEMLCFTGVTHIASDGNRGIALGLTNTMNMFGSGILQQLTGKLLDFFWSGEKTEEGLRHYTVQDFEFALLFFIVVFVISIILALRMKENQHA